MGDPRKIRKKYSPPRHPWVKSRIEDEKTLKKEYGVPRNKEIWKMETVLVKFKDQTKRLAALNTPQASLESQRLHKRLMKYGLLQEEDPLDKTLGITLSTLLDRRLQTVVFRLGLAKSMKQARQFITHKHIMVQGKIITSPSYLVPVAKEAGVQFSARSAIADPEHPERQVPETAEPAGAVPKGPISEEAAQELEKQPDKAAIKGKKAPEETTDEAAAEPAEAIPESPEEESKEETTQEGGQQEAAATSKEETA